MGKKRKVPSTPVASESSQLILRNLMLRMWMVMVIKGLHHQLPHQLNLRVLKSRYVNSLFAVCGTYVQYSQELGKINPIYLFYEIVSKNAAGDTGKPGDKHYKCYHCNWKVLTIT